MCNKNSSKKNIMISIAVLIIFLIVSYFIGYKVAYDRFEQSVALNHLSYENVYAKIKDIDAQYITVDGLEMNSDEYRRELILEVYGETELIWAGAPINISELKVGQIISITLVLVDGSVNTSDDFITDIEKIQVIHDAEEQELQIGTDIDKNIVEITDVSTLESITNSFIYFGRPNCPACEIFLPLLNDVIKEENINFLSVQAYSIVFIKSMPGA